MDPVTDEKRSKSSMPNWNGHGSVRQCPSSIRENDCERSTIRLREIARVSHGKHKRMKRGMRAQLPNRSNRRIEIENESETSRMFRCGSIRHGTLGNVLEQTLRMQKRSRWLPPSVRNHRWRTGPRIFQLIPSSFFPCDRDRPRNALRRL